MTDIREILTGSFTYYVEIMHSGTAVWSHVHNTVWETTGDYYTARLYAKAVRQDNPKCRVRIVEKLPNFPTHYIDLTKQPPDSESRGAVS